MPGENEANEAIARKSVTTSRSIRIPIVNIVITKNTTKRR